MYSIKEKPPLRTSVQIGTEKNERRVLACNVIVRIDTSFILIL